MRAPISDRALSRLVGEALQARLVARDQFTAYDITMALRMRLLHLEIAHERVRTLVHGFMRAVMAAGHYQTTSTRFWGKRARLYEPAASSMQPGIPGILPLQLN